MSQNEESAKSVTERFEWNFLREVRESVRQAAAAGSVEEALSILNKCADRHGFDLREGFMDWVRGEAGSPIPKILYHHTKVSYLKNIMSEGLKPKIHIKNRPVNKFSIAANDKSHSMHELCASYNNNVGQSLWLTEIPFRIFIYTPEYAFDPGSQFVRIEINTSGIFIVRNSFEYATYITAETIMPSSFISICLVDGREGILSEVSISEMETIIAKME